jgi:hypothetical protein
MKTQAWGWLVAGVLAAGLNASYHDGGLQWAHELADRVESRADTVLALTTGRADRLIEAAQLVRDSDRTSSSSCRIATALVRAQTEIARTETQLARWESQSSRSSREISDRELAQLDRIEANRILVEDRVNAELVRIRVPRVAAVPVAFNMDSVNVRTICPRVRVPQIHVSIPAVPMVRIPSPEIHVNLDGGGPI